MIQLTLSNRVGKIWINSKLVTSITVYEGKTVITFDQDNEVWVKESPDEIGELWNFVR